MPLFAPGGRVAFFYLGIFAVSLLLSFALTSDSALNHAHYINSWLRVLKADKRAIFTSASKAQQAADYLIQQSERTAEVVA